MTVEKGQWYRFPNGRVVEVLLVTEVRAPLRDGDSKPRLVTEVRVSVLDTDGAMTNVKYDFALAFLLNHTERVRVAPPILV